MKLGECVRLSEDVALWTLSAACAPRARDGIGVGVWLALCTRCWRLLRCRWCSPCGCCLLTCLPYFAPSRLLLLLLLLLLLQGTPANSREAVAAREWITSNGGATFIPSWGKFWLAALGVYSWEGVNPLPPELWLLPNWFPLHPWRFWCHCRMVYLPMSYIYGCKATGPITPLVQQLRGELYVSAYDRIDWNAARFQVGVHTVVELCCWEGGGGDCRHCVSCSSVSSLSPTHQGNRQTHPQTETDVQTDLKGSWQMIMPTHRRADRQTSILSMCACLFYLCLPCLLGCPSRVRRQVCTHDLYSPHTWIADRLFDVLRQYERVAPRWLRGRGMRFIASYIHAEDDQTNYVDIGPVNKVINALAVWHMANTPAAAHSPRSVDQLRDAFQLHVARLEDYLWVAEDGMKMQGYNGSQLWDTAFAVQALIDGGTCRVCVCVPNAVGGDMGREGDPASMVEVCKGCPACTTVTTTLLNYNRATWVRLLVTARTTNRSRHQPHHPASARLHRQVPDR